MTKPLFYGWILLGVLWLVFAFNLGFPAYGGPLINSAMAIQLGFSRETLGLITSFYIIMSGLPGPVVAMAVNRFGVRRTLVAGSLMNVTGATLMATRGEFRRGCVPRASAWWSVAACAPARRSRARPRCRAGSCGAVRMAMSILYSSGAIGGFFATKYILPWAIGSGGNWRAGWWVIVDAVRGGRRARAAVRARAARRHGTQARR